MKPFYQKSEKIGLNLNFNILTAVLIVKSPHFKKCRMLLSDPETNIPELRNYNLYQRAF